MPKAHFAHGGLFIAIVGGDGAGKTTMIDECVAWLGAEFEVVRMHMGKPSWSRTTTLVRGILKIGTLLGLYPFEGDMYEESPGPHGYPWFIRAVCTARDRYLTYARARRVSSNGGVVLCDRYSLPGFLEMDGPQCRHAMTVSHAPNRVHQYLARMEESYYQGLARPDLLIVLKVEPSLAVKRKRDESGAAVRARSAQVWNLDWTTHPASVIDASQSVPQILAQIKELVWAWL